MDCFNDECQYFNKEYHGNCWDIGEVDDCEDAYSEKGWRERKIKLHADYLSMVNWEKMSLEALEKIRKVYIADHEPKPRLMCAKYATCGSTDSYTVSCSTCGNYEAPKE